MRFKKPCLGCGKLFRRTGKFSKFCEECIDKKMENRKHAYKQKKMRSTHNCPYLKSNGMNCVHKHNSPLTSRRKFKCIYNTPLKCRAYCEWLDMRNTTTLDKKVDSTLLKTAKNGISKVISTIIPTTKLRQRLNNGNLKDN